MNECDFCGNMYTPIPRVSSIMCISCATESNNYILARETDIKGNVKRKKLLKRQAILKEYNTVKFTGIKETINQICRGCSRNFVTGAAYKDRYLYCGYCTKLRKVLKRK